MKSRAPRPVGNYKVEENSRTTIRECLKLSLENSADAADEFRQRLGWGKYPLKLSELASMYDQFSSSIRREMKRTLFLYVPKKQAEMYEHPLKEWEPTPTRFPETILNIEEGMKCFALDRYGAAVAHMMLVAEFGAIEVGKTERSKTWLAEREQGTQPDRAARCEVETRRTKTLQAIGAVASLDARDGTRMAA